MTDDLKSHATAAESRNALLTQRLNGRARAERPRPAPSAGPRPAPLTVAQERLWMAHLLGSSLVEYNVPVAWRLRGSLRPDALQRAVREVVRRHDILRTTYDGDETPQQMVRPEVTIGWEQSGDSGPGPVDGALSRAVAAAERDLEEPFDLRHGPVLRARLTRLGDEDWLFVVVVHHIAFDGWSAGLLGREIGAWYDAIVRGGTPRLPTLTAQYADLAGDRRRRPADHAGYWRSQLADPAPADLLGGRTAPPGAADVSRHRFALADGVLQRLTRLGAAHGASLFTTLFAAFQLLTARCAGHSDVLTGLPVNTRDSVDAEGLIGLFVTVIPSRAEVDDRLTFAEHLDRVRQNVVNGIAHAEPGPGVEHDPPRTVFSLESEEDCPLRLTGLDARTVPLLGARAIRDLDLTVVLDKHGNGAGYIDYATGLLEPAAVRDLAHAYAGLLDELADGFNRRITDYPVALGAWPRQTPAPSAPHPAVPSSDRSPETLEARISTVFAALLPAGPALEAGDDLRQRGADSLVLVRAAGRLREVLGRPVPLRTLIRSRTVAEIAASLGDGEAGAGDSPTPPATGDVGDRFDLSPLQQSIWVREKLTPGTSDYLLTVVWELTGPVEPDLLRRAFDRVVERHSALRTAVRDKQGVPFQEVVAAVPVPWWYHDAAAEPVERTRELLRGWLAEETEPFDLTRPPLIRARALRTAPEQHTLIVTAHHIVFDGWSTNVLLAELHEAYTRLAAGTADDRPGPATTLIEEVRRRRAWLDGPEARERLAAGVARLDGVTELDLPTDRGSGRPPGGARHEFSLPPELGAGLRDLARSENVSLFTVLLAAFSELTGRLAGQRDVLLGVPSAGRSRPELDDVIGLFLNTLLLRTRAGGEAPFRDLLAHVAEQLADALDNQDVPFETLVERLRPAREPGRHPLTDIMVNFANTPAAAPRLGPARVAEGEVDSSDPKFWLTVYATVHDDRIAFEWVYRTDVFSPARIEAMAAQFTYLLGQVVADPGRAARDYSLRAPQLALRTPDPRRSLPAPPDATVTDDFARMAAAHPGATAVADDRGTRTYAQLAHDVEEIEAAITRLSAPGDVVALRVPPSTGLVAGMLAVLGARRVLLVLDPDQPADRNTMLIEQAGAALLLSGTGRAGDSRCDVTASVLAVPGGPRRPAGQPGGEPAYLSFTSGSTGIPKAVIGSRQGLAHFLRWQRETFGIGPGDRGAQLTSLSFDVLYRDVLLPVTSGATLCIPPERRDPDLLFAWLRSAGVTYLHAVPSLARAWLATATADRRVPSLRLVFFAGEPLSGLLAGEVRRRIGAARIVNLYGPTETTLAKVAGVVDPEAGDGRIPVGEPLPGAQALVVDGDGRLCSVGEPGEVWLRTRARSLGYLNAPEEQARRFVVNPFTGDPTDVIFRTGDRGRLRPDGTLDLFGRLDDQLKVRGIRIEPGEIESHLCRHPAVRAAAVTVTDEAGLVAYVDLPAGSPVDGSALRAFLAATLPDQLIPGAFHRVERIPATASGKIDRRAVRGLTGTRLASGDRHVAPRTPTELVLADIWARVLGTPAVGVHDDFFQLGGDSLRLVHATALARDEGIDLDVADHYEHRTVAGLAGVADGRTGRTDTRRNGPLVRLREGDRRRPLFCVHPSGGSVAWYVPLSRALPEGRGLHAFELPGAYQPGDPQKRVEDLAATYVRHLREVQPEGPYAILGWSLGGAVAYEMARQLRAEGQSTAPLILLEPTLPGDPASVASHREAAELYQRATDLVGLMSEAEPDSAEQEWRRTAVHDFFHEAGWPPAEAELADRLPLTACGLLHGAFAAYQPDPYEGKLDLVLSAEGRAAGTSAVVHGSADAYIQGWRDITGGPVEVHDSGPDHMTMVGPGNATALADLCERLLE
ncbi:amino acid adenylation domain-containing protein [Actinoplanes sp. NPDC048796]|uniref:amino acid adenylation domain-containing protein n=1 Tax=Actinoplanes sp. NPDC048796 TaxID=3155640 RepID=UPI003411E893